MDFGLLHSHLEATIGSGFGDPVRVVPEKTFLVRGGLTPAMPTNTGHFLFARRFKTSQTIH